MQQRVWVKVHPFDATSLMAGAEVKAIDGLKYTLFDDQDRYKYHASIEGHYLCPIDRILNDTSYERPISFKLFKSSARERHSLLFNL